MKEVVCVASEVMCPWIGPQHLLVRHGEVCPYVQLQPVLSLLLKSVESLREQMNSIHLQQHTERIDSLQQQVKTVRTLQQSLDSLQQEQQVKSDQTLEQQIKRVDSLQTQMDNLESQVQRNLVTFINKSFENSSGDVMMSTGEIAVSSPPISPSIKIKKPGIVSTIFGGINETTIDSEQEVRPPSPMSSPRQHQPMMEYSQPQPINQRIQLRPPFTLSKPHGLAVDSEGNVFISDTGNHKIRKITKQGIMTTFAGSIGGFADGSGSNARFFHPERLAVDKEGNIFVADSGNHRIRKITQQGQVTTIAGNGKRGYADKTASLSMFNEPRGIALDGKGNIYVADTWNHRIRKISLDGEGTVCTVAGCGKEGFADGNCLSAMFFKPCSLVVGLNDDIYVADAENNRIRKIFEDTVTTLAGNGRNGFADGPGNKAMFSKPRGMTWDEEGNILVADHVNNRIRKVTLNGIVTTFSGNGIPGGDDGLVTNATYASPVELTSDWEGNLYIAEIFNHRIRKIGRW